MQVISYCRVSSEEQAEKDLSIPAQRKALRRWAVDQSLPIVKEFTDEGESAYAPAHKRPGFMDMMSFCRKNKVKYILVHKLDRFSRNREESILFKSMLRKHGVTVKSISENYDPETPQGFLYEGIIEVFNQFYSMNLATETIKGMKENAERGFHNGGRTPYGYQLETIEENGRPHRRVVPGDPEEVKVVQEIYRLAVKEGMGAKSISRELNRRKIPAPRKGRGWCNGTVAFILNNPIYCGDLVWRRRRAVAPGEYRISKPDEVVLNSGSIPALIDRELYDRWKVMASERSFERPKAVGGHAEFLLGRMIRCGSCGSTYIGRRHKYTTRRGEVHHRIQYHCWARAMTLRGFGPRLLGGRS